MDSFEDNTWDLAIDYSCFMDDVASPAFSWVNQSNGMDIDFSQSGSGPPQQEFSESECPKKRGRMEGSSKPLSKAVRERLRRGKLNESFSDLSSILKLDRTAKSDKLAILTDAIKVLKQQRTETEEHKEENKRLLKEIENLKAEKNELREEKLMLKVEKEKLEQQLGMKAMGVSAPYTAAPQAGSNKMGVYVSYGVVPMWHYLPSSTRDTSRDHVLRPPAA